MKRIVISTILGMSVAACFGCGSDATTTTGTLGTTLQTQVKAAAPEISGAASIQLKESKIGGGVISMGETWASGSGNYDVWKVVRSYTYPTDEGTVGMENMYKALHEIKSKVDANQTTCEASPFTAKSVASPFVSFSGTDYTYTCGLNSGSMADQYPGGFALQSSGGVHYINYGWQWAGNANGGSIGAVLARYTEATSAIFYEMVNCVNCGLGQSDSFSQRMELDGNVDAKTFTIRFAVRSSAGSGIYNILAKGTSTGASNYMLFKYDGNGSDQYYCVAGDAVTSDFQALTGSASVPSNCSSLQTDVDALTKFVAADVPFAVSDFTGSSILLTF